MIAKRKPKKCESCRAPLTTDGINERICCMESAIKAGREYQAKLDRKREKEQREADRQQRAALRPLQFWLKRTEKAVNAVARERDKEMPCISCGTNDASEWHAGHWKSVGANSALRYDLANIHRQCNQCNVFKGGNATEYEARLPARIGQAEVDRLKYAPRSRKWTRTECQAIEAEAIAKLKELRK